MLTDDVLRQAGLILAAGIAAVPVAAALRLPKMVVLLGMGLLVGPSALGWVDEPLSGIGAQLVFTYGVALILFHGGLGVSLRVISRTAVGLGMLVLPGVFLTTIVVALVAAPVFDIPWTVALLIGAVLAPTDPAILIPLFERLGLRPKVAQTLIAESAFNDPTGSVLAVTLAGMVASTGTTTVLGSAEEFARDLGLGLLVGVVAGLLLAVMLSSNRISIWKDSPAVAVLALVALQYVTADDIGGSALLAAFVMGLIVGNMEMFGFVHGDEHEEELEVTITQFSEIATLAVFVMLGINLPLDALGRYWLQGLLVIGVFILIARPLTVYACLWPDRRGGWTRNEKLYLCWTRETGVVPAAMAALFLSRGIEGADIAVAMVAVAIVATLVLQASTAGWLARRLDLLEDPPPSGVTATG